ncbi:hypothetical protein Pve01_30180 [Planomonospora venezuelensis]|nr:hypothetical protein Pve01_30180 [Planomonospora venezuelensis]
MRSPANPSNRDIARLTAAVFTAHAAAKEPANITIMPEAKAGTAHGGMGHMDSPVIPATSSTAPNPPTPSPSFPIRPIGAPRSCKYGVLS